MDSFPINLTDLVVVAILVLSGLFAFLRGFVRELLVLLSWVVAGIATYFGAPMVEPLMRAIISVEIIADVTGGLLIFLTVLVCLSIVAHFASKPIHSSDLQAVAATGGDAVVTAQVDVRDQGGLDDAVAAAQDRFGRLDAAVAVAGVVAGGRPLWAPHVGGADRLG